MNTKSIPSRFLLPASLGLLVACNSGDVNFPDVVGAVNPTGSPGVIQFTAVSYTVTEGEAVNVRVSRSGGSAGWAAVDYECVDGSAEAGSDYTAANGRLTWPNAGFGNRTVSIPITNDNIAEAAESFTVTLSNVSGAILGANTSVPVNIVDNDVAAVKVSGAVTAVNDVTIDGIRYDTDATIVSVNGLPATPSDLKRGQFVGLEGDVNFSNATGTAAEISYSASVIGPVENINAADRRLVVLGQTILINENTALDPSIDPDTFKGLRTGATAQVSGYRNTDGDIVATRIEPDTTSVSAQLVGTVAALDPANMLFTVNGLTVDYTSATFIDLPMGMPEISQLVLVRGSLSNGILVVDEITSAVKEE